MKERSIPLVTNVSQLNHVIFIADYDAPLTEAGDYTDKYHSICKMIKPHLSVRTRLPDPPAEMPKTAYPSIPITSFVAFSNLVDQVVSILHDLNFTRQQVKF